MTKKNERTEFEEAFENPEDLAWFRDQTYPLVEPMNSLVGPYDDLPAYHVRLGPLDYQRLSFLAEDAHLKEEAYLSRLIHDVLVARREELLASFLGKLEANEAASKGGIA